MHLLLQDTRSLDEEAPAVDLGHEPADIVVLSFSDSDLGALAAAASEAPGDAPSLRLAPLGQLRHPMSVDLYVESVLAQARCVVVRVLGGLDYWRYGAEETAIACRQAGIALALLPGDARDDERLRELSTLPAPALARLDAFFRAGGRENMVRLLRYAAHLGGLRDDPGEEPVPVPAFGELPPAVPNRGRPLAAIVTYRSHLLSGDTGTWDALARALDARGLDSRGVFLDSLKSPTTASGVAALLREWRPAVVLNATGFSAWAGNTGVLDAPGAPVLQMVLSGASRDAWAASGRGVSQADLAMQVALPELDGRLLTGAVSFKAERAPVPGSQFARTVNEPDPGGIALAADRAAGWARLAGLPREQRRVAVVLSDYPGAPGQRGHAVGLDTFASLRAVLGLLAENGYDVRPGPVDLADAPPQPIMSVADYRRALAELPIAAAVLAAWGRPEDDATVEDGAFTLRHLRCGRAVLLIEPDRGAQGDRTAGDRKAGYHDPDLPPCHGYIAARLWLQSQADVVVHLGTHGVLEWLPGKAAALSAGCAPRALNGSLPVVYPFIVNNPGEAAAAKRRLGAVTVGHMTPPLARATLHGPARELEQLLDEYAGADGLDRRRTAALRRDILGRAAESGLDGESGADPAMADDDRLARLDAYLCDLKELQVRDGLHVFGEAPADPGALVAAIGLRDRAPLDASAAGERASLLAALDGRFVPPGPAGAPTRNRPDVLPTGRNLCSLDPRAVPTRSAVALAERAASALLRRHLQDHGEHLRTVVVDLWGSTGLRTGGEDLALALLLLGVRPVWDEGSARVAGFTVEPLATLDRPRVDVTLRISGLFRDIFEAQVALFDAAVRAVADRDERPDWNPLAGSADTRRVFGALPGGYGAGDGSAQGWLAASAGVYGRASGTDGRALAARVRDADAFLHVQDTRETDLLEGPDWAAHEGGFAAAARLLGGAPALYHMDTSGAETRVRTVAEEIRRVVRGRASNPAWIAGLMRHGYRGAAEMARTVQGLCAFAAALPDRFDPQFDLLWDATLGDPAVDSFLRGANPDARADMAARFQAVRAAGLWHPRLNDVATA